MQPARSEASKVDQFLIIWSRASLSPFMQISRSFWLPPPVRLTVTSAAILQVLAMSMVGTRACAPAAEIPRPLSAAASTVLAANERIAGRALVAAAVEDEAVRMRASVSIPPIRLQYSTTGGPLLQPEFLAVDSAANVGPGFLPADGCAFLKRGRGPIPPLRPLSIRS